MNKKMALSILFGVPTVLLAYVYYSLGINNYWQLFLFSCMVILGYMPGMLIMRVLQTNFVRNAIQKSLSDFGENER